MQELSDEVHHPIALSVFPQQRNGEWGACQSILGEELNGMRGEVCFISHIFPVGVEGATGTGRLQQGREVVLCLRPRLYVNQEIEPRYSRPHNSHTPFYHMGIQENRVMNLRTQSKVIGVMHPNIFVNPHVSLVKYLRS